MPGLLTERMGHFPRPFVREAAKRWAVCGASTVPQRRYRGVHQASAKTGGGTNIGDSRSRAVWKKAQDSLTCSGLAEISVTRHSTGTRFGPKRCSLLISLGRGGANLPPVRFQRHPDGTTGDLRVNRDRSNGSVGKKESKQARSRTGQESMNWWVGDESYAYCPLCLCVIYVRGG